MLDPGIAIADELFAYIIESLEERGELEREPDVMFALWVTLTRYLVASGWTVEQLLVDCGWHATDQASEGRA